VCFTEVAPGMGVKVKCCEVCGIAVHSLCRHLVASNCKPAAMRGSTVLHHWMPAACVVENEYNATDAVVEGQTSLCMYCREPCVGMLLPVEEPIWQCTWCQHVCHVRCHNREHAVLKPPSGGGKTRGGSGKGKRSKNSKSKLGRHPQSCTNLAEREWASAGVPPAPRARRLSSVAPDGALSAGEEADRPLRPISPDLNAPAAAGKLPRRGRRSSSARGKSHWRTSSQDLSQASAAPRAPGQPDRISCDDAMLGRRSHAWWEGHGSPDPAAPLTPGRPPLPALSLGGRAEPPALEAENKEVCRLGLVGRMVLPPTAVAEQRAEPEQESPSEASSPSGASPPAEELFPEASPASWTSRAMQAGKQASQQANELLEGLYRKGRSRTMRIHGPAGKPTYTIGALSPWHRPLLVFINTKSGPQVGSGLRRWFLRAFNPLQVVELPREDPLAALRLFSGVANLRVLVVGGDGTVGWVLGCIDVLKREKEMQLNAESMPEGAGSPPEYPPPARWTPPPVGVLPLGTGNDLARCLNWGGGIYTVRESGMTSLMYDLQRAAVVLLDRWNVAITSQLPAEGKKAAPRMATVDKAMNNYLGLGVDAKAALDFHNTREQYPQWFQSQLGNKMWYGVVGATDLIGHSCASLPHAVHLEVDGLPVPVPDDIEGLMLLNISSYMGGVNLWTCGRSSAEPNDFADSGGAPPPWQYGQQLPGDVPQSMSDGILEVVAVYGTWHLGQLQVGLSKAERLARGRHIRLVMSGTLPMQIDGEPWMQGPCQMDIHCKGQAFMLRRLGSNSAGVMASIVGEVLESCESSGVLTLAQRQAIIGELAARLGPML